jgi:hypothetical protein
MRPPKAVPASCATLQPSVIPVTTDALLPTFVSVKPMITSLPATPAAGQTVIIPHTSTATIAIELELATNLPLSPVSHVQGKVFNRFVNIMMENTDFSVAAADPNMQNLQALGITLTNYFGTTHPSEPNYCAIYGGDNFGMDNDDFNQVPLNVSNVWDLLADKGISFGSYQEDLPYPGFEGFQFLNPGSDADNYVRKHNPPVLFNTNVQDPSRLNTIKSFDQFFEDLNNNALPQHMFITPNELNDAHDTGITYGADFLFSFLAPLLENPFFMNNTLVVINFDENVTDDIANNVLTILISDTMPKELIGTTDANVYTHYSNIATVEANWDLETLGRWDVAANVYSYVANVTGDVVRPPQVPLGSFFLNESYPGPFAVKNTGGVLIPNTTLVVNGRPVFKDVVEQWGSLQECTVYDDLSVVPPDGLRLPKAIPASCASLQPNILATATSSPVSTSTSVVISNSATSTGTSSPVSTSTSVVVSNSATSTGTSSPVSTSTSAVVSNSATSTGASSPVSTSTSVVVSNSATSTGASSPVSTSSAALSAVTAAPAGGSSSNGVAPPSGSSSNGAAPAGGSSSNGAAPASGSSPNGAAPASGSSSNGAAPAGGSSPNGVAPSGLLPGAATTAGAAPTMFTGASVSAFGDLSKALLIGSGLAVLALAL